MRHADTVRFAFGQHGVFARTQGLGTFSEERFEFPQIPGADVQEVMEALVISPHVFGNGFRTLPFQQSEEAKKVPGQAGALRGVVKSFPTER